MQPTKDHVGRRVKVDIYADPAYLLAVDGSMGWVNYGNAVYNTFNLARLELVEDPPKEKLPSAPKESVGVENR